MVIKMSGESSRQAAQVDDEDESGDAEGSATVVCVVKYGTNGVLEISPDFSHGRKPYRIEVGLAYFLCTAFLCISML